MFENHIYPYLQKLQDRVYVSKMVKICGVGESKAETVILDLIENQTNPTIAPYAKNGEVHFRVTASASNHEEAEKLLAPVIQELYNRFHENIYTTKEAESLEEVVVKELLSRNLTLATAESCTGGLLTGRLVNVAGVSSVLKEGFITYSNEAKMKYLKVKEDTLKQYGAVSEHTASEMVSGAARAAGSSAALAITGIAGPDGGTEEKPVGLVYIALSHAGGTVCREFRFGGSRTEIKWRASQSALDMIRRHILGI
jgi:nicotinamide-nucleotide amidase